MTRYAPGLNVRASFQSHMSTCPAKRVIWDIKGLTGSTQPILQRIGTISVGQMVGAWEFWSREGQIKQGSYQGQTHSVTIAVDSGSAEFAAWDLDKLDTILRKYVVRMCNDGTV